MLTTRSLKAAEYTSLLASAAGVVAAEVTRQSLLATAPLSLALFLGMINRRRADERNEENFSADLYEVRQDLLSLDRGVAQSIKTLRKQLLAIPSLPEDLNFQQVEATITAARAEVEARFREDLQHLEQGLIQEVATLQQNLAQKLENLPTVPASPDIRNLEAKMDAVCQTVRDRLEPLETLNFQTVFAGVHQLQTDLAQLREHLQTLAQEAPPHWSALQAQIDTLTQQLTQSASPTQISLLTQQVSELRAEISQLQQARSGQTLKQEMAPLLTVVKYLYERQAHLQEEVKETVQTEVQKGLAPFQEADWHSVQNGIARLQTEMSQIKHKMVYPVIQTQNGYHGPSTN